jgi:hypothetical protein
MPRGGKPGNKGGGNPAASGTPGNGGGAPVGNGNATSNAKKAETLFWLAQELYDGGDFDTFLSRQGNQLILSLSCHSSITSFPQTCAGLLLYTTTQ